MQSYESWMQNNEALAENRQATLDMELEMAKLAEDIQPLMTSVLEMAQGLLGWFNNLGDGTQKAIVGVLALVAAISPLAGMVEGVSKVMPTLLNLMGKLDPKTAALAVSLAAITTLVAMVIDAWDDMTGLERVVAVLGLLAAAALTAAVAVGAFQSAASMGIAAAGIVIGIAAVAAAVTAANQRAQSSQANIPGLAQGGLVPPGDPFFAVLGDNKKEVEVVSPYSTIKQAAGEAVRENLPARQGGSSTANLYLDGTKVGRAIFPYIQGEATRQGVRLIEGGSVW